MAPTPSQVLTAVKDSGVKYVLESGWDTAPGGWVTYALWKPSGVLLHHTANEGTPGNDPSLGWVLSPGSLAPVRACHFLIGRDGTVYVICAEGCYHAGSGGPLAIPGLTIPVDQGNAYFYGIEIESKGESAITTALPGSTDGFTPAQVVAATNLTAALLHLLGRDENSVFRHRDWAPGRKTDVLQPLAFWRGLVHARLHGVTPTPVPLPTIHLANLAYGNHVANADVVLLQRELNSHLNLHLSVDGLFGPATLAAVKTFQNAVHIAVDGVPGPITVSKMGLRGI